MPVPNQRDESLIDRFNRLTNELAELQANIISRWGRIPHVAVDPTLPPDGAVWMRSDNEALSWRANGTTMSAPGGRVGSALVAGADQTGIAAVDTAITGMSITFTAVAGRRYRLYWTFPVLQSAVAGTYILNWRLGGVNQGIISRQSITASFIMTCAGVHDLGVLGAGSKVIAMSISTSSGTIDIPSASAENSRMYIDDVGV